MSFFIRTGNSIKQNEKILSKQNKGKKRKGHEHSSERKSKHKKGGDEDIESDDEDEVPVAQQNSNNIAYESDENYETAQEKKLRLAKLYLEEIERKERKLRENGEVGKDDITNYLKEDLREKTHRNRKTVADTYSGYDDSGILRLSCKEQYLPITCLVVSFDNKYVYSGSKGSAIVKWSLEEGKKQKVVKHKDLKGNKKSLGIVLCLAISSDNKFLVSGSSNCEINVWNPETLAHIHTFSGHKGEVTGVAFQRNQHTLFSVSTDRCVKVWNLTEMVYVESLYGHQKKITAVDAFLSERALTSGEDNSVHLWKIVEESQLIYNANGGVDGVKFVNESFFLSCGSDGALCLWGVLKKRPLCTIHKAHGVDETNDQPHWLTSISTLINTDLVASGSCNGVVKLWKCRDDFKKLELLFDIPIKGFVNGLQFTHDGKYLVAAVGSEHKLGRWQVMKDVKNSVLVIPLCKKS
ncbi:hypothetical protein R5R35_012590 [Gryllus longicercus]|uniref:U3 small nucleolar RNA-interacting protein 2 n=1 Tax=Gryllus longicercus TaxID=2509291 RepID=A0AAN9VN48_9ORTH